MTVIFALIYFYLTRETFGLRTVTNLSAYLFPLFLVAMAQSVVMLTGGIDLAVGQMMSLATVVLATQMYDTSLSKVSAVGTVLIGERSSGWLPAASLPSSSCRRSSSHSPRPSFGRVGRSSS